MGTRKGVNSTTNANLQTKRCADRATIRTGSFLWNSSYTLNGRAWGISWWLFYLTACVRKWSKFPLCTKQSALHMHCTENSKQRFPEMKPRGLVPYFYSHVSVSDLYNPMISPQTHYGKIGRPIVGIYKSLTDKRTRPCSFISGNICFEFSVQCMCSADCFVHRGNLLHFHTYCIQ